MVLNFVDITKRKQNESEMQLAVNAREQQARLFDTTLSSIADLAYTFDQEGRFLFANQPLANLLGLTPEAMVGKNSSISVIRATWPRNCTNRFARFFRPRKSFATKLLPPTRLAGPATKSTSCDQS